MRSRGWNDWNDNEFGRTDLGFVLAGNPTVKLIRVQVASAGGSDLV